MHYYAHGSALLTSEEVFEAPIYDSLTAFFAERSARRSPQTLRFPTGELTAENAVTGFAAGPGTAPVPFQEIGLGRPLTIMVREVYTGKYPKGGAFGGGSKDMLITSAVKSITSFGAKPLALNYLLKDVSSKSRIDRPPANTDGTSILFYSPALLEKSLSLNLTMVFDSFPQDAFNQVGNAFSDIARIPIFIPHSMYMVAAGLITKLIGKVGEALFDGKPVFSSSDGLDIYLPGKPPLPPGFILITSDNVDQLDPQFRKNYQVNAGGKVVDGNGNEYAGEIPYIVISVDGTPDDQLKSFAPTAASAAIISRFFGIKDGQEQPLSELVDAIKLYNDLHFRRQIVELDQRLSSATGDEKKSLEEKRKALAANIVEELLKPAS